MENFNKIVRFVLNFLITMGWLWLFQNLHWIKFGATNDLPFWQQLVLTALVCWLIQWLVGVIYLTFVVVTLGAGCITLPVYFAVWGFLTLSGVAAITGWFSIEVPFFWTGLLMSCAFALRIPEPITITRTTVQETGQELDRHLP